MFEEKNKGKIVIRTESENGKINSRMSREGMAKSTEITLTTLLINFVSLSIEKGKNPKELIDKHLPGIIETVESAKKIN
jgi:hypothetical protein